MENIQLTRELAASGFDTYDLRRLVKAGELARVRRGAYARPLTQDAEEELRHRRLIRATMPQLDSGAVVSHHSAAVLHGLPTWRESLDRVHITRCRSAGGQRRSIVHVHVAPYTEDDVELLDGIVVTSLARTVLDVARTRPFEQAVAIGDRALAIGLDRAALDLGLGAMTRWPGVRAARRVCDFVDGRSESPGESVSRVRLIAVGVPAPDLQVKVLDNSGRFVGRCDLGWEEQRTLGEFDGRVKYGRLLGPGTSIEEVVYAEKIREDRIRDCGWQVVRWTWDDLARPEQIRDRLQRAFNRAQA